MCVFVFTCAQFGMIPFYTKVCVDAYKRHMTMLQSRNVSFFLSFPLFCM